MYQVADIEVEAVGKTDAFKDALLDKGPKRVMDSGDSEMQQREQALEDVILRAAQPDIPPVYVADLWRLVLGPHMRSTGG